MVPSLQPQATGAQESVRALERALAESRAQWNDATRLAFDRSHADVAVASGRKVARELADLSEELAAALSALQ